jgi:hypothetical protein
MAVISDARPRTHRIDFDQAHRVATAFLDAPRTSAEPIVRAAYDALATQSSRWFRRLSDGSAKRPVRVVYTCAPEPYPTARELGEHVRASRVLELAPARYDRDRQHPLLDTTVGGAYDRLRAVHDIISHAWLGYGFDRDGEFSAWMTEDRLYTGLARWALATELHAEHSVRWTTGELAAHKAVLLPESLLASSRRRGLVSPDAQADGREVPGALKPTRTWLPSQVGLEPE